MKVNYCFGLLVIASFMILTGALPGQLAEKTRFKVVPFSELYREMKEKTEKGKEPLNPVVSVSPGGAKPAATGLVPPAQPPLAIVTDWAKTKVLVSNLNHLGKTGWEAMASGSNGILFRRGEDGKRAWNYRLLKVPPSDLTGKGILAADDEVLLLALEALAGQGWEPSLGILNETNGLLLKRTIPFEQLPNPAERKKEDFKKEEFKKFKEEKK